MCIKIDQSTIKVIPLYLFGKNISMFIHHLSLLVDVRLFRLPKLGPAVL